jgi:GPN-loop GTPase
MSLEDLSHPSDLSILLSLMEDTKFGQKHHRLTAALCELIEDFGLISFIPMAVEDKECMAFVLQDVDKANGYIFGGLTAGNESIVEAAHAHKRTDEYIEMMANRYCPVIRK